MIDLGRFSHRTVAHDALARPYNPLVEQSGSDNPAVIQRVPFFRLKLKGRSEYNVVTRPVGVPR